MSIEENIKTAEEHLEAEANRELDRLLGTLADDSVYEESLLEKPVEGKAEIAPPPHSWLAHSPSVNSFTRPSKNHRPVFSDRCRTV